VAATGEALELTVRNESKRVVRVSSHFPFHEVNPRLVFDRQAARGHRLHLPSGASERWGPGETRTVRLVRFGGKGGEAADDAEVTDGADGADELERTR
jgi:urease beta subunit